MLTRDLKLAYGTARRELGDESKVVSATGTQTATFTLGSSQNWSAVLATYGNGSQPPPSPSVTGFSPTSGQVGSSVTIIGSGFTGTTDVTFGSKSAGLGNFTVNNDTQITVTVPSEATTGLICVTVSSNGCSATNFTVTPAPAYIGQIGSVSNTSGVTQSNLSVTVGASGVKAGDTVLLGVAALGSVTVSGASDSAGNTYHVDVMRAFDGTGPCTSALISGPVTNPLSQGQTITVTVSQGKAWGFAADEWSGLAGAVDQTGAADSNSVSGTTVSVSTAAATTASNEAVVAATCTTVNPGISAGSGYMLTRDLKLAYGTARRELGDESKVVSATGTQTATFTLGSSQNWSAVLATYAPGVTQAAAQNIVLILTDDQRFDTLQYMPNVESLLVGHGLRFTNAFDNNPLCCPARATMMTGLTSGHTGVWWNQNGSDGGYQAFVANGDQNRTIFGWLSAAGYHTGFVGKYLNGYTISKASWIQPGVDDWQAFLIDGTGTTGCQPDGYWATCYSNNGVLEKHPSTEYSTTTSGDKAVSFISNAPASQPLFLYYAPRAPHLPTLPQSQYAAACSNVPNISGPSYNTTIMNGPVYETSLAAWGPSKQAEWQGHWHDDCRTLLSVDDQVARIVQALQNTGRLGNTLIMFVSDNGMLFGEHRWNNKIVPYDQSIHVPLVIRDDALIPTGMQGTTTDDLVTNLDFAPTFLSAAGLTRTGLDGQTLVPLLTGVPGFMAESNILIEHGGETDVPPYCGVRTTGWMYARYSTGEEELYNLAVDPFELTNVVGDPTNASELAQDRAAAEALCVPMPPGFAWG